MSVTPWGRIPARLREFLQMSRQLQDVKDLLLSNQTRAFQGTHPNPLCRFGRKCFSQGDEDGITLEILRRIGAQRDGAFAELGVGNGTENNTLVLLALGWHGFWVGGDDLAFETEPRVASRFAYVRDWITLDNITELVRRGMGAVDARTLDVVSLDLDGNDFYFVEKLLSDGVRPKLFIVEYNAKFPPPIRFRITYDARHTWAGDDYFGASLTSFHDLFDRFSYQLVCCNAQTGANAFFVDRAFAEQFEDVPKDIGQIYVEPRYQFLNHFGHAPSLKTIAAIVNASDPITRDGSLAPSE